MMLPATPPHRANLASCPTVVTANTGSREPGAARRRVLHVINGEHYSGAERVQDLLAAQLPACGFEVAFACVKPGKFAATRQSTAAPLHLTPMRSKIDVRVVTRLVRILRRDQSVLIHAHTPRSALVARLASLVARVPLVYHVHSPATRDTTCRWRNRVNQWSERLSLAGAAALIAVSNSLRQHMLAEGYSAERTFAVPNGVPVPPRRRDDAPPATTWTIGTIALFRPRKGLEVLLQALALLQQRRFPVRLRAVGAFETPDYHQLILRRVHELGLEQHIHWTGFTSDITSELQQMDLFVLPSLFGEGLPMVVLEAMAAGVPVVATRVEGIPEAIEDDVSGVLAEPADPNHLADGMARVIRGEVSWHELRRQALRRHAERFSDRSMAEQVAGVYRQILDCRGP